MSQTVKIKVHLTNSTPRYLSALTLVSPHFFLDTLKKTEQFHFIYLTVFYIDLISPSRSVFQPSNRI